MKYYKLLTVNEIRKRVESNPEYSIGSDYFEKIARWVGLILIPGTDVSKDLSLLNGETFVEPWMFFEVDGNGEMIDEEEEPQEEEPREMRKPVQLIMNDQWLTALCDDGSIWYQEVNSGWQEEFDIKDFNPELDQ